MNSDDASPRRRRRMERLARAAEGLGLNPKVAAGFALLALAARVGGAEAATPTARTVAADETTVDLGGKGR